MQGLSQYVLKLFGGGNIVGFARLHMESFSFVIQEGSKHRVANLERIVPFAPLTCVSCS